ncbi:MAG: response regulator [Bacteriovoracaceae bacterium]|jgi:CheY-like chemotaxis protein|nr:response regulator [Bacteriovoracaceae bacterium]
MFEIEKNRIQVEVMTKMDEVKACQAKENNSKGFLSKFLKPFAENQQPETGLKVLVCEDDKLQRLILKKSLEKRGIEAIFSETPVRVLNQNYLKNFDFVITDNRMPYMTGTQFTEYVEEELNLELPMYMLSGDSYLKHELPITKVRRGIFEKFEKLEKVLDEIFDDFKNYKKEIKQREESSINFNSTVSA